MDKEDDAAPPYVPSPVAKWYAKFVVDHALSLALGILALVVTVTYIGFFVSGFTLDNGAGAFRVRFGVESDAIDALTGAQRLTLFDPLGSGTANMTTQSRPSFTLRLLFDNFLADETEGAQNLLTRDILTSVKDFEDRIAGVDDFDKYCLITPPATTCDPPFSLTNLAFPSIVTAGNSTILVPDGNGDLVDDLEADLLLPLASVPAYSPYKDFTVHKEFSADNLESSILASTFRFGLPLEGYLSSEDRQDEQVSIVQNWIGESFYDMLVENENASDDYRTLYVGNRVTNNDIDGIILNDATYAGGSVLFVFLYVWFHSGSLFLTAMGISHILMSLPVSYFIFTTVLGIGYFSTLNFLGVFVILGIGADDIFVELDAFKQAAWIRNGDVAGPPERRLAFALERSIKAMTITSASTAAAFAANLASAIIPIRLFGLFTTLLVLSNFFLVCTWFPAIITLRERWIAARHARSVAASSEGDAKKPPTPGARKLELLLSGAYADFVEKHSRKIVVAGAILTVVSLYLVSTLEPTSDSDLVPPEVNGRRFGDLAEESFEIDASPSRLYIIWGIAGIDRDEIDTSDPNSLGEVEFYGESDLDKWDPDLSPAAQEFFVEACARMALADPLDYLYPDQVYCPLKEMHEYRNSSGIEPVIPEAADFQDALRNWTLSVTGGEPTHGLLGDQRTSRRSDLLGTVGFDLETGDLLYLAMISNSTHYDRFLAEGSQVYVGFMELANEFVDTLNEDAPPGLQGSYQASMNWQGWATDRNLQVTGFLSIGISLVACAIIVFATTRDWIVTALTTATVTGAVASAIAGLVLIGYKLGPLESIAMTIIVGLTLDYTVHFSHSYVESHAATRGGRARHALRDMGISVLSAAITTMGASSLLLFTTVTLFLKFGVFLAFTIASALLYSLVIFFALLFTFGPEQEAHTPIASSKAAGIGSDTSVELAKPALE